MAAVQVYGAIRQAIGGGLPLSPNGITAGVVWA